MSKWNELYEVIAKGQVLMPDDAEYAASLRRWSKAAEVNSVSQTPDFQLTNPTVMLIVSMLY